MDKPFAFDPDDDSKYITEKEAVDLYILEYVGTPEWFENRLSFDEWVDIHLDTEV